MMQLTEARESEHFTAQGTMGRMDNYYRWILGTFGDNVGRRVWDAGAGIGHVSDLLAERTDFVLATEFTDRNLQALRERFPRNDRVLVEYCDLTSPAALELATHKIDTIVTLDVLEHIEDDNSALRRYFEVLQPGGALLIKVPAHPFLYGTMDEASSHYRRYGKGELRSKLAAAGFVVERVRHMNMVATLPYFLKGRLFKKRSNFSGTVNAGRVGLYNRLMPWFELTEKILRPPFGLSLIGVARKPARNAI